MKEKIRRICETILLLFCAVQCGRAVYARYAEFLGKGKIVPSFILICGILLFGTAFSAVLIWNAEWFGPLVRLKRAFPFLRRTLAVLICFIPGILYNFIRFSEPYQGLWIRIFLSGFFIIIAAWLWEQENEIRFSAFLPCVLIFSVGFVMLTQFQDITDYPFSIGWSEGNRMWDYSVLFGKDLYDFPQDQTIPAYIDIGRQSLWGLIYLLPKVNIVMARVWNDILFTIPCALLG